jgi:hypothetical protein
VTAPKNEKASESPYEWNPVLRVSGKRTACLSTTRLCEAAESRHTQFIAHTARQKRRTKNAGHKMFDNFCHES